MKKVIEYLFGTVLPCFVKNWQKKYATLVIAYLKRSFEEKSFHFFYWSDIIIHYNPYDIYCNSLVLDLLKRIILKLYFAHPIILNLFFFIYLFNSISKLSFIQFYTTLSFKNENYI